ncbi:uncharacterized protein LOC100368992 [Saccoglossus kowalevskii]|uniref:Uncharacterized protein LOC100368992 n=1 Tax=Saccoglossus kowalevskii TaxID=10224 RepID=A0ABM0GVX8_SACKO|nr:PREDICTED: uncharacterized protein LOC100368992 [Saccoglossus kowalevskii]
MKMRVILLIAFLFGLLTIITAVKLDETEDAEETLEDLEEEIFEEVVARETGRVDRTFTPKKCCKIGRRVATKSLYCNIDLYQVEKKNNMAHRRKMKFHGPVPEGDSSYKNLMVKVEKCYPSKSTRSMFTKCCEYQSRIMRDLEDCRKITDSVERRRCRKQVNGRA